MVELTDAADDDDDAAAVTFPEADVEAVAVGAAVDESVERVDAPYAFPAAVAVATDADIAAFWETMKNKNMTAVIVPYGVTEIPDYAFEGCTLLTSVVLPVTVRKIGRGAFRGCTSLTAIVIPDSVTTIGQWAFRNCTSLTTASIPSGATLEKDSSRDGPFYNSPTTVTTRG